MSLEHPAQSSPACGNAGRCCVGRPGSPCAPLHSAHSGPPLHRSCSQPGWHFHADFSFPAKSRACLSDPLALRPARPYVAPLNTARPFYPGTVQLCCGGRGETGASFKSLLRPSWRNSQEDGPRPRRPLPPCPGLCYSCKDNSVTENADWGDNLI